jgi:aspartate aminotransferase, mitochondrial
MRILLWAGSARIVFSAAAAHSASAEASSSIASSTTTTTTPSSSSSPADSVWDKIPEGPADAILGIARAYRACTAANKVNVCVGAYRDGSGTPWILPSVRKAEERMLLDPTENKEYLPIEGDPAFVDGALRFAYGVDAPLDRIAGVQTLSGTGACRIGGQFLANFYSSSNIYVPDRKFLVGRHMTAHCIDCSSDF